MELFRAIGIHNELLQYFLAGVLFLLLCRALFGLVVWGKKMSKGALLFLAIFPFITIFPIPPPQFKNVEKAKQEQRKKRENSGDPPSDEENSN